MVGVSAVGGSFLVSFFFFQVVLDYTGYCQMKLGVLALLQV